MPRNFGLHRTTHERSYSTWPMWMIAFIAVGIIGMALQLPRPA